MKNNKTIGVMIRFWTNDLKVENSRRKNACWDSGMLIIEANEEKKITHQVVPFNNIDELMPKLKKLLNKHKIMMVSS